jgi:hypothetical protein
LKGSLRNRIIAWSLVPTVIILIATALVNLYAYQQVTENLVIERDRDLTHLAAKLLSSELETFRDPLAEQYLAVFDGWVAFNANGTILAAEPRIYESGQSDWFQNTSLYRILRSPEPAAKQQAALPACFAWTRRPTVRCTPAWQSSTAAKATASTWWMATAR